MKEFADVMEEELHNLPVEERRKIWLQTEKNYWGSFEVQTEQIRIQTEGEYERAVAGVRHDQKGVSNERDKLVTAQIHLIRKLTEVEHQLSDLGRKYDEYDVELVKMQNHRQDKRHYIAKKADVVAKHMQSFFRQKYEEEVVHAQHGRPTADPSISTLNRAIESARAAAFAETTRRASQAEANAQDLSHTRSPEGASLSTAEPRNAAAHVVDADGWSIGWLKSVEPLSPSMKKLLELPVRRPIRIRPGRPFTPDHLATVHERSDPKDSKWVSCMIQATGEVQSQRCRRCDRNQGVFAECVVAVGDSLLQKCGNCEWNRQGCHMPTALSTQAPAAKHTGHSLVLRGQQPGRTEASGGQPGGSGPGEPWPLDEERTLLEPAQMPIPTESLDANYVHMGFQALNGFTAANAQSRHAHPPHDIMAPSVHVSETSTGRPAAVNGRLLAEEEICRDNLVLRHNGIVYTYPPCVEGVPLAKVNESHPYWDPKWPSIRNLIEPQLKQWEEKYRIAIIKRQNGDISSAKFQTGRQVNRGRTILRFLEHGEISPYQLLGKRYTYTGKGAITSYDTLFRMCETLLDLAKYNLDVTPVEWLRQRLHEISTEKGHSFNFAKTIHDFYSDPKLGYIRAKNGYKPIGRPSGYRVRTADETKQGGANAGLRQKRKSTHSIADEASDSSYRTPSQSPRTGGESRQSPNQDAANAPPELKRLKSHSPLLAAPGDESSAESASEADSRCGASLGKLDWRVDQVKTRLFTSSTKTTQYWHWQEHRRIFEHQLVTDTDPVKWAVYDEPVDFNVALDDIIQVDWSKDALQVHVAMRQVGSSLSKTDGMPIGDVMAAFKRESSMLRFVGYCRQRRLKVVEIPA